MEMNRKLANPQQQALEDVHSSNFKLLKDASTI